MPFKPGQSGNPQGRRKRPPSQAGTVRQAWEELIKEQPFLVKEAFERGLEGKKALGYLELGAKLGGEIGAQGEGHTQIAIIFNSSLDSGKLRPGTDAIRVIEVTPQPQLEEAELLEQIPNEFQSTIPREQVTARS